MCVSHSMSQRKQSHEWEQTHRHCLLSGWMYVLIQWLNETLLIMNKTQSTFLLCFDVWVLWWMMEEQEMIVSFWLKRNRWKWGKCENMVQNYTENKHSSLFLSTENVCVCEHLLLRFVVVLLICIEWVGRKRRNKHLLLTIVQDWWKLVFLVNQLSVAE